MTSALWGTLALLTGIAGLAFGLVGIYRAASGGQATERSAKEETWGHPRNPATEIKKRLPPAPIGFMWEMKVVRNDDGHPVLTLSLLDLKSSEPQAARSVDLGWRRATGQAWRGFYQEYRVIGMSTFYDDIVQPMADWALAEAAKRDKSDGADFYEVIA